MGQSGALREVMPPSIAWSQPLQHMHTHQPFNPPSLTTTPTSNIYTTTSHINIPKSNPYTNSNHLPKSTIYISKSNTSKNNTLSTYPTKYLYIKNYYLNKNLNPISIYLNKCLHQIYLYTKITHLNKISK